MPRPKRDVPWLEPRDNGVYYAMWYDAAKNRVGKESLKTRDPKEAALAFGRFLLQGPKSGRLDGPDGISVRQALDDYVREHVEQNDDRGRPYVVDQERQKAIVVHLKAYFGQKLLKDIGILESRGYIDARRRGEIGGGKRRKAKTGSDATIRRELNLLVAAANHAARWKRIAANDMPQIELPREDRGAADAPWLTKEQLNDALARAADLGCSPDATPTQKRLHDFILLAYYTAARKRSIERLKKSQVNLATGRINLMPEGKKPTKKRQPVVPIYPEIRPTVERLMQTEGSWLLGGEYDFYRQFVWLLEGMGIVGWPHLLRHSRATHLLHDGESIYLVASLLGDTVKTVENVYGHSSPEFLATKSGLGPNLREVK